MLLLTQNQKIKLVDTHFPGKNCFYVENITYPLTQAFIDNLLLNSPIELSQSNDLNLNKSETSWNQYQNIPKTSFTYWLL